MRHLVILSLLLFCFALAGCVIKVKPAIEFYPFEIELDD